MLTVGASHRTASSALLGDFGQAALTFRAQLRDGVHGPTGVPLSELVVLSTCARVEVYAVTEQSAAEEAAHVVGRAVFGSEGASRTSYRLRGHEAVRHVCRVASGLDSFVVGEHEIAGQVQRAFKDVVRERVDATVLDGVAAVARRASSRVRAETGVGRYSASVGSVAVAIVRERLGEDLSRSEALVVGAGKAGLLVARALRYSGVGRLSVVNRSEDRARRVAAEVGGRTAGLDRLPELLASADVVLSATGSDETVVDPTTAREALARRGPGRGPLLLLDLALPGDVDPAVGRLDGVELLTLEDVKERVHRHIDLRRDELGAAEAVVDEVLEEFVRQQEATDVDGLIGALRRSIEDVRATEVGRFLERRHPDVPPSREELDQLTRSIVNKILDDPMRRLRAAPPPGSAGRLLLGLARELVQSARRDGSSPR